jgi:hypothetical protein
LNVIRPAIWLKRESGQMRISRAEWMNWHLPVRIITPTRWSKK